MYFKESTIFSYIPSKIPYLNNNLQHDKHHSKFVCSNNMSLPTQVLRNTLMAERADIGRSNIKVINPGNGNAPQGTHVFNVIKNPRLPFRVPFSYGDFEFTRLAFTVPSKHHIIYCIDKTSWSAMNSLQKHKFLVLMQIFWQNTTVLKMLFEITLVKYLEGDCLLILSDHSLCLTSF